MTSVSGLRAPHPVPAGDPYSAVPMSLFLCLDSLSFCVLCPTRAKSCGFCAFRSDTQHAASRPITPSQMGRFRSFRGEQHPSVYVHPSGRGVRIFSNSFVLFR